MLELLPVIVFQYKMILIAVGIAVLKPPVKNCWIEVKRFEITFISTYIITKQNSYHNVKSA